MIDNFFYFVGSFFFIDRPIVGAPLQSGDGVELRSIALITAFFDFSMIGLENEHDA